VMLVPFDHALMERAIDIAASPPEGSVWRALSGAGRTGRG
jgi:hypothetical protein